VKFSKALIELKITKMKALNIIGFNSPVWWIAFYGAIFAKVLPVGVYSTSGPSACEYIATHSEVEIIVAENRIHLKKYLKIWDQLPALKYIVLYDDTVPQNLPENRKD